MPIQIISITIAFFVVCFFLYRYRRLTKVVGKLTEVERQLNIDEEKLTTTRQVLVELVEQQNNLEVDLAQLNNTITLTQQQVENATKTADLANEAADAIYDKALLNAQERLEDSMEKEAAKYNSAIQAYLNEYAQVQQDAVEGIRALSEQTIAAKNTLEDYISKVRAIIDAKKRAMLEEQEQRFYMLQIPEADLKEMEKLKEIIPFLRNPEVFNKFIYKVYYEKPTGDLVGRVVGTKTSGIYKITNIINGMCYVGQTRSFSDRFRQHIKRGVGAEAATRNKLYPAMQQVGVENFMFEIIEECAPSELNDREQYWQEVFGAKEFGYSIK